MYDLVLHRVQAEAIEKDIDLVDERTAEPATLSFIPSGGLPGCPPWLAGEQRVGRSQLTENIVPGSLPCLDIGGALVVLSDPFVQQAAFGLAQRPLLKLACDLVPEFPDEASPLVDRQPPEGLKDLLGIHLHVTSSRYSTADHRSNPARSMALRIEEAKDEHRTLFTRRSPDRPGTRAYWHLS